MRNKELGVENQIFFSPRNQGRELVAIAVVVVVVVAVIILLSFPFKKE